MNHRGVQKSKARVKREGRGWSGYEKGGIRGGNQEEGSRNYE